MWVSQLATLIRGNPGADRGEREIDAFGGPAKRHLLVSHRRGHRRRQLRWHMRLAHVAHEANALTGDGADEALLVAAVTERPPRGVDAAGQCRFRHDPSAPDCGDQVVLADDAVATLQEVDQEVEHQRLAAAQLPPLDVERIVAEQEEQTFPRGRISIASGGPDDAVAAAEEREVNE
jgi:hypothetical protein